MRTLRVGIDLSPLALTRAGSARYLTSLLEHLEAETQLELCRYELGGSGQVAKVARDTGWYLGALPVMAWRDGLDVLHCPTFRAPIRSVVPVAVTVHDLAVLRHPRTFNSWTRSYSAFALPRVARTAAAIVTGSEFSRGEIVELLGVPPERVRVIPYGVGPPFTEAGPSAKGEYVLAVSTLEPRKNLPRLVEGFHQARLPGCELRIVGARGWGDVRVDEGRRVRWLGEVGDEELARLYRGALCVAYVSLYEGFGLPVLEAMASGAAVVTSQAPPFREFADGAALLVDALDPGAIAAGLVEAADRRAELGALGRARAAGYSWARMARATLEVYREAAA